MAWGTQYSIRSRVPRCPQRSEGALEQAVAPTARGTNLLGAKPLHHVAGVAPVSAGQAEIGGAPDGHVADGALEGEALADGALGAAHFAAAVAAVHAELCQENTPREGHLVLAEPQPCVQPPAQQLSPLNCPRICLEAPSGWESGCCLGILVCFPYTIKGGQSER